MSRMLPGLLSWWGHMMGTVQLCCFLDIYMCGGKNQKWNKQTHTHIPLATRLLLRHTAKDTQPVSLSLEASRGWHLLWVLWHEP
jgi:hypothetical protein